MTEDTDATTLGVRPAADPAGRGAGGAGARDGVEHADVTALRDALDRLVIRWACEPGCDPDDHTDDCDRRVRLYGRDLDALIAAVRADATRATEAEVAGLRAGAAIGRALLERAEAERDALYRDFTSAMADLRAAKVTPAICQQAFVEVAEAMGEDDGLDTDEDAYFGHMARVLNRLIGARLATEPPVCTCYPGTDEHDYSCPTAWAARNPRPPEPDRTEALVNALVNNIQDALVHLEHEHYGWAIQSLDAALAAQPAEPEAEPVCVSCGDTEDNALHRSQTHPSAHPFTPAPR